MIRRVIFSLFFTTSTLLAHSAPSHAWGLPEALSRPIFRILLQETSEGAQLVSRILNREVSVVTTRDYGQTLQALASPGRESLARDLAERVLTIEAEAGILEDLGRLQFVAQRELRLAPSATRTELQSVQAEARLPVLTFRSAREAFLSHPLSQTVDHSWSRLELNPILRPALEAVRIARVQHTRSRMTMQLDGSRESLDRLAEVLQSFVQSVDRFSEVLRLSQERGISLTADERRVLLREWDELTAHTLDREARSYLKSRRPESFSPLVRAYRQARNQLESARTAF